jgi:hypothetical protein
VPLSYAIDHEYGVIVVTASGMVTAAEAADLQQRVSKDPEYDPRRPALIDLTGAIKLEWTTEQARALAAGTVTDRSTRRAMVVGSEHDFGVARMFQTYTAVGGHGANVHVFYDYEEAMKWLSEP